VKGRGKFNIVKELESLNFNLENRIEYVCKTCRATLQKRRSLVENLAKIEKELQELVNTPYSTVNENLELKRSVLGAVNEGSTTKKSRLQDERELTPPPKECTGVQTSHLLREPSELLK
jgi:hypothetical protein